MREVTADELDELLNDDPLDDPLSEPLRDELLLDEPGPVQEALAGLKEKALNKMKERQGATEE